jgi:hypothetical protein
VKDIFTEEKKKKRNNGGLKIGAWHLPQAQHTNISRK